MAEGKEKGDNPFSFKSFIKRNSADVSRLSEQKGPLEKPSKNVKASKKKKEASKKENSEANLFPDDPEEEDNPFSFTKFVKTKKTKKQSQTSAIPLICEGSSSDDDLFSSTPPPAKETPLTGTKSLPTSTQTAKENKTIPKTDPLINEDIFESDSDSSFGLASEDSLLFKKSSNMPIDLGPPLSPIPTTRTAINGQGGVAVLLTSGGSKDEDSDLLESSSEGGTGEAIQALSVLPTLPGEKATERASVVMLKAENEKLRSELEKSQQETKKQREMNISLKKELKALKKKESEDTKALEDMVQLVESNLVSTTKRAVSAEATITKLTQEIQSLQIQLAQASPQSIQQKYEEMLRGVREKASFASMQLTTASQKAELSIRELMTGAETLRNVSEILTFIDSITEIKEQTKT